MLIVKKPRSKVQRTARPQIVSSSRADFAARKFLRCSLADRLRFADDSGTGRRKCFETPEPQKDEPMNALSDELKISKLNPSGILNETIVIFQR